MDERARRRRTAPGWMTLAAVCLVLAAATGGSLRASGLASQFFSGDPTAAQIMAGTPYNMRDPAWLDASWRENKSIFAYKVFSALFMLGYSTEMGYNYGLSDQHVRVLHLFQSRNGLPVTDMVDATCLSKIDEQLVPREQFIASTARAFPLYSHMKTLAANDVSRDTVAYLYSLPMQVLPDDLHLSDYETLQCINGQCVGFIYDANGASMGEPVDPASDYFFVGAYFNTTNDSRKPTVTQDALTVLHEYAHYLDGIMPWRKDPGQTHIGLIDTTSFYAIAYDLSRRGQPFDPYPCYPRRSSDLKDWITKYAYNTTTGCADGTAMILEDWSESFMMYVGDGRDFRAAAQQSALVAQRYAWLKTNVFHGLEYDTDLAGGIQSGCNDVYGTSNAQPAYAHCNDNYVWDYTLPTVPVMTSLAPDRQSPLTANGFTPVTWTATISGGASSVQFQFWRQKGSDPPAMVQDWGTAATYSWTPSSSDAGNWTITGYVRNAGAATAQSSLASAAFVMTAVPPPVFTDDPLLPGGPPVKVAHVAELRQAIDDLRARCGLPQFAWTDSPLVAGETRVKAVHVEELRAALADVYAAAGRTTPVYTDSPPTLAGMVIKAAHVTELRAAILAIW